MSPIRTTLLPEVHWWSSHKSWCSHEVSKRTNYQSRPFTPAEWSQHPPITIDCCRSCQQYGVAESLGYSALDHGPPGTIAVLSVLKLLSKTVFTDRQCNMEGCDFVIPPNVACYEHFLSQHTDLNIDINSLLSQIYSCSEELFQTGLKLSKLCELNICFVHFLLFFTRAYSLPCVYMYIYPFPSWGTYYETLNFELWHIHDCAIHIRRTYGEVWGHLL